MPPFLQTLAKMPTRSKALLGGGALATLLVVFVMFRIASAPSYTTLMAGISPTDTAKITESLDATGIAYELGNGGTSLKVNKADVNQARVALAAEGVSAGASGSQPGMELLDSQSLGASQQQQDATYQRAVEGEIANTLGKINGVSEPHVQIVMPEDNLFSDEATPATAAVQLGNPGDTLESGAVKGIASTVSSSVKGLKPANVTITDSTGQVLWPTSEASGQGGASGKQAAEARYNAAQEARINAMLTSTLGPGKARVVVSSDLNMDKTTKNELVYDKKGVPLTQTKDTETMKGSGSGTASGASGTANNVPSYTTNTAGGAGGTGNYKSNKSTTNYGVGKTVSKTEVAQGAVNKQSISLMVDPSVLAATGAKSPQAALAQIQASVAAAAGVDAARGDTVAASQMKFAVAKDPAASTGLIPAQFVGPAKIAGITIASLVFLFLLLRGLRKREKDALPQPEWLSQFDQPVPLAELESAYTQPMRLPTPKLPEREQDPALAQLGQLMDREPERVAAQVRQWMAEE